MSSGSVEVAEYDEAWPLSFEIIREELRRAFGLAAREIHHIGSTSVAGMWAKPVIDVLVEATELSLLDEITPELEKLGYTARGEYGIPDRRYFSRSPTAETLAVHIHAFRASDPQVVRHLLFRDFLRQHPVEAREYSELKCSLAVPYSDDREAYQAGKSNLIKALDRKAAVWASALTPDHTQ